MVFLILVVVLVFGLIVLVHEFGHMLAAKACGVAVPDFAIGMGPSIASFKRGGTRYHLCLLPIGGFVNIAGMVGDDPLNYREPGSEIPVSRQWRSKNGWQKALILCAGALMNLLLAVVVLFAMGWVGFPQRMVMISDVAVKSPAAEAGLQSGDFVLSLDGKPIINSRQFIKLVQLSIGQPVQLEVIRSQRHFSLAATPRVIPGYNSGQVSLGIAMVDLDYATPVVGMVDPKSVGYKLGIRVNDRILSMNGKPVKSGVEVMEQIANLGGSFEPESGVAQQVGPPAPPTKLGVERPGDRGGATELTITVPANTSLLSFGVGFKPELIKLPLGESITRSLQDARLMMAVMFDSIHLLFTREGMRSVSGPVGIARVIGQSAKSGLYQFLQIVMLININLVLINLLPLPALDGGRLFFVALAGIGIRISEKREALVHAIGMIMFLALLGLVTFTDLRALF